MAGAPLSAEEGALRTVLLNSEWWHHFLTRRLPFALFNNRVLERWRQAVRPEMIVIGNSGWERALLLREGAEKVPVVLLQHGIMHWIYAVSDEPVDVFLLRGPFFQRAVNERLRRKTVLHNFPEPGTTVSQSGNTERKDILFITTPYDVPALFHREDLRDILRSLLRVAHSTNRRLVIRVHPIEKISAYEQAVARVAAGVALAGRGWLLARARSGRGVRALVRGRAALFHHVSRLPAPRHPDGELRLALVPQQTPV